MALSQRELNQALKINRRAEQLAGALDQNVRRAMQEKAKVLDTALQSRSNILQAAMLNTPKQWVRVDIPPLRQSVDWAPILSTADRIRRVLPQINYKGISSINLSKIIPPPHNSMIASSPYSGFAFGNYSQHTDNEEETSDSATDSKSSVEHSRWCKNCQGQLEQDQITIQVEQDQITIQVGQDRITIQAPLSVRIPFPVAKFLSLLKVWVQGWWRFVVRIMVELFRNCNGNG